MTAPLATSAPTSPPTPAVFQLPPRATKAKETSVDQVQELAALDAPLLRQNVHWFCQLRWLVTLLLLLAAAAGHFGAILQPLGLAIPAGTMLAVAGILVVANVIYLRFIPARANGDGEPARCDNIRALRLHVWIQIVLDLLVLTAVVHVIGSVTSYAPFMYLFHIILACIFLSRVESLVVAAVAAALYGGCVALEGFGVVEPASVFTHPGRLVPDESPAAFWAWRVAFALGIWTIIWYLASRLAGALRERERRLAVANAQLNASSRERARHMLQTTHELKSPFSAIHANTQLLTGGFCGELPDKAVEVSEKIAARCQVVARQITEMLQLANLRSEGQTQPASKKLDLADIVQVAVDRATPTAAGRGISIDFHADPVSVRGVEDHLRMLADNLVGNAVNYSYDGGVVSVACSDAGDSAATLTICDHGIGIPADKLPHIFDDYYRTREAAQHNKASTGLGLAIVRDVAWAAGMDVRVESGPGWGTRFTVTIPKDRQHSALRPKPTAESHTYAVSARG